MGKTRQSANLVSDNNIFIDSTNDYVGIGSTIPSSKLSVSGSVKVSENVNISGVVTASTITASSFNGSSQIGVSTNGVYVGLTTQINFVGLGITTQENVITVSGSSRAKSYFYGSFL
jgi:hypothetical protein